MKISEKNIDMLFTDIRTGKSVLFLGQNYFTIEDNFFKNILKKLNINEDVHSLAELWTSFTQSSPNELDKLGEAIRDSAEISVYQPWFRTVMSLGWNVVLTSSINNAWMKSNVGSNFGLNIQTGSQVSDNVDIFKNFSKKDLKLISLFGDETSVPNKIDLVKLKKKTAIINNIYTQMLSRYGILVIDGISEDDWFDINRFLENIELVPYGCIYIFGMTKEKLRHIVERKNDEDWEIFEECINNGQILLDERSLKEILIELDMVDDEDEQEFNHENEVRITLRDNDCLWIPRKECTQLKNMGITVMRDEILMPLIIDDSNKQEYFADFLQQRDQKSWGYFDIIYKKEKFSFHIPRHAEELLEDAVSNQLKSSNRNRNIILLKGNSNSGKTTSLSWYAWHLVKEGIKKAKNDRYIVIYISGDPSLYDCEWKNTLVDFIKNSINDNKTAKGERIRNTIIIWDNYNSQTKKADYIKLYNYLNECNAILIGSIYLFESNSVGGKNKSTVLQGVSFNELQPLSASLEGDAIKVLKNILTKINLEQPEKANKSKDVYLFDYLMNFAKFNYSKEWQTVRNLLKSRLYSEADRSEKVTNELYNLFISKNADSFSDVQEVIGGLGIGKVAQAMFLELPEERRLKNISLINSIREMNFILAVAGQFNNSPALPLSVLLGVITDGKHYKGEYSRLNHILRSDSMVEYDNNSATGNILVSFRHPSEANAYLENNDCIGDTRKEKEIDVLIRLIKACRWDVFEEAMAIITLIRAFGTNSYGKVGDKPQSRGGYKEYQQYWCEIIDALKSCATGNPEAMLVLGHFTRDNVQYDETLSDEKRLSTLEEACEIMRDAVEETTINSTRSRLYGEICRNLLERIRKTKNQEKLNELYEEFEDSFKDGVKSGKESAYNKNHISMIQLLDIWLNYVNENNERNDLLLSDTLDYIDQLFYSESTVISEDDDCVNVISNINKIYEHISNMNAIDIRNKFKKANNDSYVYCIAKQELIKIYMQFKNKYSNLFDNEEGQVVSSRIFFLNENAANDFRFYHEEYNKENLESIFKEIKKALQVAAENIITIFEQEYSSIDVMSYRCLLLLLKAKWMKYTGNLLLETEQMPGLSHTQWKELNRICDACQNNIRDADTLNRSIIFIKNVYEWAYTKEHPKFDRTNTEDYPNRILCLCNTAEQDSVIGIPRRFRISVNPGKTPKKLVARIDAEIIDEKKTRTSIVGRNGIYVPENINNYRDIKRSNMNISKDFSIWFNFGGPQIQDYKNSKEV